MFTPLLESHPQQTHPLFPRHSALSSSGPRSFILTPDHSTSWSSPCPDLMAFRTVLLSLVTSHSPLRPTSSFIPSILITYPPCFKCMFDTYTYALCRYLFLSLFLHVPVLPLHVLLVLTHLTCLRILRPCTQVSFILFVLHLLLTAHPDNELWSEVIKVGYARYQLSTTTQQTSSTINYLIVRDGMVRVSAVLVMIHFGIYFSKGLLVFDSFSLFNTRSFEHFILSDTDSGWAGFYNFYILILLLLWNSF